jgi:hypothetical protein
LNLSSTISAVNAHFEYHAGNSPFLLKNESEYQQWKSSKLKRYKNSNPAELVSVSGHAALSDQSLTSLAVQIRTFNFAIFASDTPGRTYSIENFLAFGNQLGLHRLDASLGANADGVTSLSAVDASDDRSRYIPYTPRGLNWHTDGYYNPSGRRIDAFSLYCVRPAPRGGSNFLLDHEMIYLRIRDTDPDLIMALMDPNVMVVPANVKNDREIRPAESSPVFLVDRETGALNMRYSARPRNIQWKSDVISQRAIALIRELLHDSEDVVKLRLQSGQGIVCNNVLHGRTAYVDGEVAETSRLFYRARYYDAITFRDSL